MEGINITDLVVNIDYYGFVRKLYIEIFEILPNVIGSSEIPFCRRRCAICHTYLIKSPMNATMLEGKIHHRIFQTPEMISTIITTIYRNLFKKPELCKKLGIVLNPNPSLIVAEKYEQTEIASGKFFRSHVDLFDPLFSCEYKSTDKTLKIFKFYPKDYHFYQLNNYLGIHNQKLGYLIYINVRYLKNKIKDQGNTMAISKKYFKTEPHLFDKEAYDINIEVLKELFEMIDAETWYHIVGPELNPEVDYLECNYCYPPIKKICYSKGKSNIIIPIKKNDN
jgi:hypothetical protein